MRSFDYARADSAANATKLAAEAGARFIGGGTNLVDLMKLDIEQPRKLVDVSRLGLHKITERPDGGLSIGATATNSDVAADARVKARYPVLTRAILAGASAQIRNKATMAGNLLQRTRCFWFYDTAAPCNKREPGSGCSAFGGFNRIHAVLGGSESCIATHPSDMAVALLALGTELATLKADGSTRKLKLADLYRLPEYQPHLETTLDPGELITSLELPALPDGAEHAYRKVRDRASYAFALVSVAGVAAVEKGVIKHMSLAFGGLAPVPWRDPKVEQVLIGQAPSTKAFEAAADALLAKAKGQGHNDFKIPLVRRTLIATLRDITGATA